MGYYTVHSLDTPKTINGKSPSDDELVAMINKAKEISEDFQYALGEEIFEDGGEECKWYDHQKDMKQLSEAFPTFIFTLSGEGEESGDIWKEYYMNGKRQVAEAKITYESFNISKLQ